MKAVTIAIATMLAWTVPAAAETATGAPAAAAGAGAAAETAPPGRGAPAGTGSAADAGQPGATGARGGTGSASPAGVPGNANGPGGASTAGVPDARANFMMKAAASGLAEVELAKIAIERSKNADVRQHAQHMLDDHTKANDTLKGIAREENVPLPQELAGVQQQMVQKLRNTEAGGFDDAYMKAEVEEHKAAVALFRTEKESGTDPRLKRFAAETLPTLEQHLEEALRVTNKIASSR